MAERSTISPTVIQWRGLSYLLPSREVNFVIHCAAAIQFDLPITEALAQNYAPTKELLELALKWENLQSWCYMSTAFVNMNLPRSSTKTTGIEEKIYDLRDATNKNCDIDGIELAEKWMSMPPDEAHKHVSPSTRVFILTDHATAGDLAE